MSIQLKNVEICWVKLDPENPDMGFDGNSPQWSLDARTRDEAVAKEWRDLGMNVNEKEDDNGSFFNLKLKKAAVKKNGAKAQPVPCVDGNLMPIADVSTIGNGSRANLSVYSFDYNYNGRAGVGFRLEAVQMLEIQVYEGSSGGEANYGFSVLEGADASATETAGLYD